MLKLPPLNYSLNAFAPLISEETMFYHYQKHHTKYVEKANQWLLDLEEDGFSGISGLTEQQILETYPGWWHIEGYRSFPQPFIDNFGQHLNHSIFWRTLAVGSKLEGVVLEYLTGYRKYDNSLFPQLGEPLGIEELKKDFIQKGVDFFGSGWLWLNYGEKTPYISTTKNGDCPLFSEQFPLIGIDLFEHSYYIDYRNDRQKYLENIWQLINWDVVAERLQICINI